MSAAGVALVKTAPRGPATGSVSDEHFDEVLVGCTKEHVDVARSVADRWNESEGSFTVYLAEVAKLARLTGLEVVDAAT